MKRDKSTVGDKIAYLSLKMVIFLVKILPRSWVYGFSRFLTSTFYHTSERRRSITQENLSRAFPDLSSDEVEKLAKTVFDSLSKTIAEILLLVTDRFDIDAAIVNKEEALSKLQALKKAHPGGWIFMTAHFSNWELGAHFLAKHGYPALAIGREGDNKEIDQKIITPFRQKYGNGSVYKKSAAVAVFKALKRGDTVGVLMDQKVNEKEGVKVTFFGREVYTTSLVATMKEKLDITVVPLFLPRLENGDYKLLVGDTIEISGDVVAMTQAYNDAIEEVVRKYPAQWFWMHNRWKV